MNKNLWSYKYNFETMELIKDWTGHFKRKNSVRDISFVTYYGKDYADKCAKKYIENYEYPGVIVRSFYSFLSGRYIPIINYEGKQRKDKE